MKTTLMSIAGVGLLACTLSLNGCGPAEDAETRVNVSTSGGEGGSDTVVQQNTVVEQRVDTVVQQNTVVEQRVDTVVKRDVDTVVRRDPETPRQSSVTTAEKSRIDAWLSAHADSLNQYGDAKSTVYTGGTPLFNETTGQRMDRYDYIVSKHPDRPWMATTQSQPRR